MAVEAFIHFEKSTASMADVKGDSTDPQFKGYLGLKDFSFSVENKAAIGSPTSGAGEGKAQFKEFMIRRSRMVLHHSCSRTVRSVATTNS